MSQEDLLLQAVADNPDDDAPRLAYADWLKARKDPRGDFIRVQIELARLPADDPGRGPLERRRKALLGKARKAWKKVCPKWARDDQDPDFDRGFLADFRCTAGDWLRHAAALVRRFPVHRVNMTATAAQMKELARSEALRRIRVLDLSYCSLGDEGVRDLVGSPNLANLTGLILYRCGVGPDGARALAGSPHLANLRSLNLMEDDVKDEGASALARSPHLKRLAHLSLRSNRMGTAGARALAGAPFVPGLETLR